MCWKRLRAARQQNGKQSPHTFLASLLPRRLAKEIADTSDYAGTLGDLPDAKLRKLAAQVNDWRIVPAGTEGYRTAEVTLGGVDTGDLDSKTMQAKAVPGPLFHRRSGGRHRLAGRLQFPMGLVVGLVCRNVSLTSRLKSG